MHSVTEAGAAAGCGYVSAGAPGVVNLHPTEYGKHSLKLLGRTDLGKKGIRQKNPHVCNSTVLAA